MSDLAEQFRFSRMVPLLVAEAHRRGYEVTGGEWWRPLRCPSCGQEPAQLDAQRLECARCGFLRLVSEKLAHLWRPRGFHRRKLAVDLNLFIRAEKRPDLVGERPECTVMEDGVDGLQDPCEVKYLWLNKTEDHAELGAFWKSIGGTHGGDWNDGNHYSLGEGR